jgi:hypothetical protein
LKGMQRYRKIAVFLGLRAKEAGRQRERFLLLRNARTAFLVGGAYTVR